MRNDLTEIVIVLDRSGSMASCRVQAQAGLNGFIEKQKFVPGEARVTLVQFDGAYEVVHAGRPLREVPPFTLVPRGKTALYDAVGRTINEVGARLAATPEADRPGLVAFAILTDGLENASREFTAARVSAMIDHQRTKYNWQFTYLGANQDAFAVADAMAIPRMATANYAAPNANQAFGCVAKNIGRMRMAAVRGDEVRNLYTPDERAEMTDEGAK